MKQYKELVALVLCDGEWKTGRNGVRVKEVFGHQARYDLREGFPATTGKKLFFKSVVQELLWFLRGETNTKTLGNSIWNEWANENGELGPIYGAQWRKWDMGYGLDRYGNVDGTEHKDQMAELITSIESNPFSRRHIVSAWNVGDLDKMALPPCHILWQVNCTTDGHMDLSLYQRSADIMLGASFNIASYSLLLHMIARAAGYVPRYFIHNIGSAHIYENHVEGAEEYIKRPHHKLPTLVFEDKPMPEPFCSRDDGLYLEPEDFWLDGYKYGKHIKFPITV